MPMLCPSIPIDKNKQGGRNYDSSKMTDFKKIGVISKADTSKIVGTNNRNQQTNVNEQRRSALLISGLRTIPRALCNVCPDSSQDLLDIYNNVGLNSETIEAINSSTFSIIYYDGSDPELYYNTSDYRFYSDADYSTLVEPADAFGAGKTYNDYVVQNAVGFVTEFPEGTTRLQVIARLNEILADPANKFNTDNQLQLNTIAPGYLTITSFGTTDPLTQYIASPVPNPRFAGIVFGDIKVSKLFGITDPSDSVTSTASLILVEGTKNTISAYRVLDF